MNQRIDDASAHRLRRHKLRKPKLRVQALEEKAREALLGHLLVRIAQGSVGRIAHGEKGFGALAFGVEVHRPADDRELVGEIQHLALAGQLGRRPRELHVIAHHGSDPRVALGVEHGGAFLGVRGSLAGDVMEQGRRLEQLHVETRAGGQEGRRDTARDVRDRRRVGDHWRRRPEAREELEARRRRGDALADGQLREAFLGRRVVHIEKYVRIVDLHVAGSGLPTRE